ncbi:MULTISPECIES: DUF4417 domain-containing protein [unclassified Butyrivibrio]|uniref:DUF4417 domain-containing protein n=1 Tax=unclassified Butyrivibrio TaxID=2639466 RepID=UPI000419C387|nr:MULTISPECIES: DUF4417 domain-containing protein [unclassified Butyrivibrio]
MGKTATNLVDEGFRVSLVETAFFDGKFEIPHIDAPKDIIIPEGMVPFSLRERSQDKNDFVCFYEHDINFREILTNTEEYVDDLKRFPGIITPDCSLYIDAPLCVQIADIYLNRAVGYYLSQQGLYVVPNIRWGDERTYKSDFLGEKVAFQGVDKHSIVSIGTYGQIKSAESKRYFREGLEEMLKELEPEVVLVYGAMPDKIFGGLLDKARFLQYPDWTSRMKQK